MEITQKINLDFGLNTLPATVFAKQYDNETRYIEITPLYCGQKYIIENGTKARFRVSKPDDHLVINDATISNGLIIVELTEQILAVAGKAEAEIELYKSSQILSSKTFNIHIEKSVYESTKIESSNEYNSLVDAIKNFNDLLSAAESANNSAKKVEQIANGIDERINNALSSINITTEITSTLEGYTGYEGYEDILGLQVDYENKKFTRLAGAAGLNAGDDFDKFPMYGGMKRCNVSDSGAITAYYGDNNYTEDGSNGQVMVYIPKFYYKVVPLKLEKIEDSPGYHIRKANYYITDTSKPGFKIHPAFINENGKEIDYFLHSAYEGSLYRTAENPPIVYNDATHTSTTFNGTDLILSRYNTKPIGNEHIKITRANAEKLCSNRGSGWHCQTIKALSALQFLIIIEFGTMNTQTALGYGIGYIQKNYETTNYAALTGSTRTLGNKSGVATLTHYQYYDQEQKKTITEQKTDSQSLATSYRGIENLWGNLFKLIQGANTYGNGTMRGGQVYICNDFNFSENKNSGNYSPVGFYASPNNDYITAFGYGNEKYDWVFIPTEASGGTSALPVGDKHYGVSDLNGYRTFIQGGAWLSGGGAGLFYIGTYKTVNNTGIDVGFRLIYLPQN